MDIIVIGGNGLIGSAVVAELSQRHQVRIAGRAGGDLVCDIKSDQSIRKMFEKAGNVDAVVMTTGTVHFAKLSEMNPEKYEIGLQDKLMGQVKVVLIGCNYLQDRGSFTLTSGILAVDPILTGSSASMVNGGLEAFTRAVAIEMPRSIRINCISPTRITEAESYASSFRGFQPVPAARTALAYSKSVEGLQTGQIYCVHG